MKPAKITALRNRISAVTHEVVCEYTNSDGSKSCLEYAIAGALLATKVFGTTYFPQAGKLSVKCDPDSDSCFAIDPTQHEEGSQAGEFHCWFASKEAGEIVDLSSRHYKTLHAEARSTNDPTQRPQWKIEVPEYVWAGAKLPPWLQLVFDQEADERLRIMIHKNSREVSRLRRMILDRPFP